MTGILQNRWKITAAMVALVMLACVSAPARGALQTFKMPQPPQEDSMQYAAVTIKTQEAADSIKGGIRGIDVSKYQGTIDWAKVAQDNVKFAMIRASFGMEADEMFVRNAQQANENGLFVGAYHYAKFTNQATMRKEAEFFISQLKKASLTYPVVLDIEAARGMNKSTLTNLCMEFMEIVKNAGYKVMLYSYTNFYRDSLNVSSLSGYDLWVANYLEQPKAFSHKMWQHTSYGTVKGISGRVDINIAYEDLRVNKMVRVDKGASDNIKLTLNARYDAGLPIDILDMELMNAAVARGIHTEIYNQLGADLEDWENCDEATVEWLNSIQYVPYQTKGNITYLLQVKLFYKGMYTNEPSAHYDEEMVESLKKFQQSRNLTVSGEIDYNTLWHLLI